MSGEISEQIRLFLIFFLSGIIIGVFFDVFRVIRKSFKISDIHTYIEDIIFGIITGIFLIFMTFVYNTGNVRFYMFFALFIGLTTYLLTISKYFIKINVIILKSIKKIIIHILKLILIPIKYILKLFKKLLNKPFMFLIINIKRLKTLLIYKKYKKISSKKKDFTL